LHKTSSIQPYTILDKNDTTGNPIGYIDLRYLTMSQVSTAFEAVKETKSLILDLRGYTKGTGYRVAQHLTQKRITSCTSINHFVVATCLGDNLEPNLNQSYQTITPDGSLYYSGRIVGLIDNSSIGPAEITCLFLKSCRPDIQFVGVPTVGALGDITNIILPGNVEVGFVGLAYVPQDGSKPSQISPDILVQETLTGLWEEKDEILERAIILLQSPH